MIRDRTPREALKLALLNLLDARAVEHPAGHQDKLAARYVLYRSDGDAIELMFEKHPTTPANLWVTERYGAALVTLGIEYRVSPATDLLAPGDDAGAMKYGRHSALKPMRQLAYADLIRFTLKTVSEFEALLDGLVARR